jgi:hypothetical protein
VPDATSEVGSHGPGFREFVESAADYAAAIRKRAREDLVLVACPDTLPVFCIHDETVRR